MKPSFRLVSLGSAFVFYSSSAKAELTNQGMLDQVILEFASRASAWQGVVTDVSSRLFWTLVTISMVWTFGMMALRRADLGDFFAEFFKFTMFTGFFWWLLTNGPGFANSIIQSLSMIGEQASGISSVTPSAIVDIGFLILKQAFVNSSVWTPVDSFIGVALSIGILILLAVIAVNMLLLLVSGWILAYAGVFFLGFGGSRWTSDMAINYYKTVLGIAVQLMVMVLLIGIGNDLLGSFYRKMNTGTLHFEELAVMLVFCLTLLLLVNRVPPLIAGIITGAGSGSAGGIGSFGAGTVVGAAMGAASVAATTASAGGAALATGAANFMGGSQALMAAFSKASENVSNGNDIMSAFSSSSPGAESSEAATGGMYTSAYAEAAGIAETSPMQSSAFSSANSGSSGTRYTGTASTNQPSSVPGGQTDLGQGTSNIGSLAKASRIAADTGSNLIKGTAAVAKGKLDSAIGKAQERVSSTIGPKHFIPWLMNFQQKQTFPIPSQDLMTTQSLKCLKMKSKPS